MTDRLPLDAAAHARFETLGLDFLARFYRVEVDRRPGNLEALAELGHVLTRLGRYDEGLAVDREFVRHCPKNSTAHYNLACSLALMERPAEALDALEHSVALGYDDAAHLLADEDLVSLRTEPRFRALVARLDGGRG